MQVDVGRYSCTVRVRFGFALSYFWLLFVFVAYFATLIGIAVVRARRMQAMSDYVLGGRRMSGFTSALSASSSGTSGWVILVFPALALQHGLGEMWTALALVAGIYCSWTIIAKRLRRYTIAAGDSLTMPEFLEKRFEDDTGLVRTVAALVTVFFIVFYVASGLIAGAKLLETMFGLNRTLGVLTTLVAVASYTFIGGFLAVSRTDVFQASLMLAAFIVIPLWLIVVTDNPFEGLGATTPGFWNPLTDRQDDPISVVFLLSALGWGLGYLGSQRVVQRFMAVRSESTMPMSRNVGTAWMLLVYVFALLLGLVALPALAEIGRLDEVLDDPERVFLVVTQAFFHPVIGGLLLCAVIAAVMSTADSQLLLASATATDDLPIVRRYAHGLDANAKVRLGRTLLVATGIVAAGLSIASEESVHFLVSYAWGGMGAAFAPVTILALYWRRFNASGALASVVAGTVTASIWSSFEGGPGGIMDIEPATPGCVVAALAGIIVALVTKPPSAAVVELFDTVNSQTRATVEAS